MQTEQPIKDYNQNVYDLGFAIGTGVLLITVVIIGAFAMGKWILNSLNKKIDKVLDEVGELKDKITPITNYINVQIRHKLNGDYDEE